jgi:NAD(P)-dependent dehydrogenase (short-subunit alcohol dehydrogenase family)
MEGFPGAGERLNLIGCEVKAGWHRGAFLMLDSWVYCGERVGQPQEVASAVAYFASEQAGFITGQTLSVSGGLTMA